MLNNGTVKSLKGLPEGTTGTFSTFKVLAISQVMGSTFLNVADFFTLLYLLAPQPGQLSSTEKSGKIPLRCRNGWAAEHISHRFNGSVFERPEPC